MLQAPTARQAVVAESPWVTSDLAAMPPRQKFKQMTIAGLVAVAALAACRKEVPPPPVPDELPRPKVASSSYALDFKYVRLGR